MYLNYLAGKGFHRLQITDKKTKLIKRTAKNGFGCMASLTDGVKGLK
jgi:hypothetical protein